MRLHSLEIQAFGPFSDRQVVDFDALSGQGLFLLNGPTGAGKSSVLDAVCFALYGSVPGARHAAKRLRSDHAADGVAPEVVLEFSAGGRRFRVERSPSWDRPARRGGGTTLEQARTLLSEWVDGGWAQKSARNDEAGHELQALLGMDKEQFTKVVMLPQGEFAAFLRADAKTRRELLQRLFSTTRFEDLEAHLVERSQRAVRELAEQDRLQQNLLHRAIEEAERHDVAALDLGVDPADSTAGPDAVASLTAALTARREAAATEGLELSEESAQADGALLALRRRRERFHALDDLRARQREHDETGPAVTDALDLLQRHDEARGLATLLHLDDEAADAVARADRARRVSADRVRENATAREFLAGADTAPLDAGQGRIDDADRAGLVEACAAAASELAILRSALPDEQRLVALRSELDTCTTRGSALEERTAATEADIARHGRELATAAEDLAEARRAAEGISHLRSELEAARTTENLVVRFRETEARRSAAEDDHRTASARFLELKERWLAMLQERLEQAAVELAEGLVDGAPCGVCGSTTHPAPATSNGGERITLDAEQAARRRQTEAEEHLRAAQDLRDALRLEAADLSARGGGTTPEQAAEITAAARGRLEGAEAALGRAAAIERSMGDLTRAGEALRRALDDLTTERAAVDSRGVSLRDQETVLAERLAALQRGAASLTARATAVQGAAAALDALLEALDIERTASRSLSASTRRLRTALDATPFASANAARAALLDTGDRERLTDVVRQREALGHRLEAGWLDDTVQLGLREESEGVTSPTDEDERAAVSAAERLRSRAQTAAIGAEVLAHSVTQLETYARRLEELERVAAPLREQAAVITALAETARGGGENLYKMPLATYVLASRLEQVAAAATERLLQMSDGRYALVHSDATSGNRRSGLGLNVIDGWTGHRRDTATLSGGESFMASLALALGLADVVQQESGGLDIETLFVDEGFGSLDDQALEQVMDTLEGLRSGGRVVGLVSHVAELKQRVGAQLRVAKGRQGSTLHFVEQPVSV